MKRSCTLQAYPLLCGSHVVQQRHATFRDKCAVPVLQDGIWTAVQRQLQHGDAGGPLLGAAQLARLVAAPGLRCPSSLAAALHQVGQQARCLASCRPVISGSTVAHQVTLCIGVGGQAGDACLDPAIAYAGRCAGAASSRCSSCAEPRGARFGGRCLRQLNEYVNTVGKLDSILRPPTVLTLVKSTEDHRTGLLRLHRSIHHADGLAAARAFAAVYIESWQAEHFAAGLAAPLGGQNLALVRQGGRLGLLRPAALAAEPPPQAHLAHVESAAGERHIGLCVCAWGVRC